MLTQPFSAPARPHTAPILAGDCGTATLPAKRRKPARVDLPQTPGRIKTSAGARKLGCLSSPILRPPSPHRLLLTGPTPSPDLGARSKTAPASPLCLFATVTLFAFARFFNALPRAARCIPHL